MHCNARGVESYRIPAERARKGATRADARTRASAIATPLGIIIHGPLVLRVIACVLMATVDSSSAPGTGITSPPQGLLRSTLSGMSTLRDRAEAARQELARVRRLVINASANSAQGAGNTAVAVPQETASPAPSAGPPGDAEWVLTELRNSYEQLLSAQAAELQALQTELDASRAVTALERSRASQLDTVVAQALADRDAAAAELARLPAALDAVTAGLQSERALRQAAEEAMRASLRREQEARAALLEAQAARAASLASAKIVGTQTESAGCRDQANQVETPTQDAGVQTKGDVQDGGSIPANPLQAMGNFLGAAGLDASLLHPFWLPPR
jgi:hypothetical protein